MMNERADDLARRDDEREAGGGHDRAVRLREVLNGDHRGQWDDRKHSVRFVVGMTPVLSPSAASPQPRLTLMVDADGNPRIEFLNDQGKVVSRLPQK